MVKGNIIERITELTGFTDSEITLIIEKFETKHFRKKEILLKAGDIARELYFVVDGCLRIFYQKNGNDVSVFFFTENMFAGAYDSFISCQPGRLSIEALEDSELLAITYSGMQELYNEFPRANELIRKILEERFINLHNLFTSQIMDSPEERYLNMLKNNPGLLNRIPQHYIATFLGVTSVSLSRIRNRTAKKQP